MKVSRNTSWFWFLLARLFLYGWMFFPAYMIVQDLLWWNVLTYRYSYFFISYVFMLALMWPLLLFSLFLYFLGTRSLKKHRMSLALAGHDLTSKEELYRFRFSEVYDQRGLWRFWHLAKAVVPFVLFLLCGVFAFQTRHWVGIKERALGGYVLSFLFVVLGLFASSLLLWRAWKEIQIAQPIFKSGGNVEHHMEDIVLEDRQISPSNDEA